MKRLILGAIAVAFAMLGAPALAATCPSYPYTLANGQTADATQVMANFNSILSCANTNVARAGANSDITSLSGLLTPLSISQGGTGSANIFGGTNTWTGANTFSSTITGNATSSSKWAAPITLTLAGAATGSVSLDGSANVTLTSTATALGVVQVRNQQASGVSGTGEVIPGTTWQTLVLNTTLSNTVSGASLGSNLVTLPAGTYHIHAQVPVSSANNVGACRVYNSTDSVVIFRGGNVGFTTSSYGVIPIDGAFALAGTKAIALQCRGVGPLTVSSNVAENDGTPEVYEDVTIEKIG